MKQPNKAAIVLHSDGQKLRLEAKLARNRARGQRTPAELEQAVVEAYASEPNIGYRGLASRFGIAPGTVTRIMRRRANTARPGTPDPREDPRDRIRLLSDLLTEALELLDTRTGRRKELGQRIRTELSK